MDSAATHRLATNFYFDRTFNCDAVKILPGEYYFTKKDIVIVTVLGSCVSACLRDKVSGIGGMNHFMLPGSDQETPNSPSMCYGNYAMEILINELLKAGAKRENLEAKVFGGGKVVRSLTVINVGERNAKFVRDYLKIENIKIVAEDLIDIHPRKVFFFPKTGKVLVKKLKVVSDTSITRSEKAYADKLVHGGLQGGAVDLF